MCCIESKFVTSLFLEFNKQNVLWAILRNVKELPDNIGNDIDVLVGEKNLDLAEECVRLVSKDYELPIVGIIKKYKYTCIILEICSEDRRTLPIDLIEGCYSKSIENVDTKYGLETRRLENGIWTVTRGFESASTLMKELLPHGVIAERCRYSIAEGVKEESKEFSRALQPILDEKTIKWLLDRCKKGEWEIIEKESSNIRAKAKNKYGRRIRVAPGYWYSTLKHYLSPRFSAFIVIIGPDGSGKTTIADELVYQLKKNPFKITRHVPKNIGVLPKLGEIKGGIKKVFFRKNAGNKQVMPGEYLSGMNNPVHSPFLGSLYIIWYGLDMFIGRMLLRRWRGQGGLIVFARYYYDYYFQLAQKNTPRWLIDIVGLIVPKPDLVFTIRRSPQEIHNGKPELTIKEIDRQQKAIDKIMNNNSRFHSLDGSGGVNATTSQAIEIIMDFLKNKYN